jgi:Domain of unknown function (DUF4148)
MPFNQDMSPGRRVFGARSHFAAPTFLRTEKTMNIRIIAIIFAAATAATSAFADADHRYPDASVGNGWGRNSASVPTATMASNSGSIEHPGKTREQVRQELIQAQRDGLLPTSKTDYPPSPELIARNRALYEVVEPKWATRP